MPHKSFYKGDLKAGRLSDVPDIGMLPGVPRGNELMAAKWFITKKNKQKH